YPLIEKPVRTSAALPPCSTSRVLGSNALCSWRSAVSTSLARAGTIRRRIESRRMIFRARHSKIVLRSCFPVPSGSHHGQEPLRAGRCAPAGGDHAGTVEARGHGLWQSDHSGGAE